MMPALKRFFSAAILCCVLTMCFSSAAAVTLTDAQKKELLYLTQYAPVVVVMRPTDILKESSTETTLRIALEGVLKITKLNLLAELPQTFSLTVPKEEAAEIHTNGLILCLKWNKNTKHWQRSAQPDTLKSIVYQPDAYDYVFGQLFHRETLYRADFVREVQGAWKNWNNAMADYVASRYSYFYQNKAVFDGMSVEGFLHEQEVAVFRVTKAADVPRVQRELKALFLNSRIQYRIALPGQPSYDELIAFENKLDDIFYSQKKSALSAFLSQKGLTVTGYGMNILDGFVDVHVLKLNKEKEALFRKYVIASPYVRLHDSAGPELPL